MCALEVKLIGTDGSSRIRATISGLETVSSVSAKGNLVEILSTDHPNLVVTPPREAVGLVMFPQSFKARGKERTPFPKTVRREIGRVPVFEGREFEVPLREGAQILIGGMRRRIYALQGERFSVRGIKLEE